MSETTDLALVAQLLADDPVWAAYAIADLQPAMTPYCRWFAHADGDAQAVALLFAGLKPPILFAKGDPAVLATALDHAALPSEVYLSVRAEHAPIIARRYNHHDRRWMWRMVLGGARGERRGAKSEGRGARAEDQSPISNLQFPNPPLSQSLSTLVAAIAADPTIGVIGPQLWYADGSLQPSARRFPTPLTGFFESTWLGRAWPSNPWARRLLMADLPADQRSDVDWLVGAALLCRRAALDAVATPDGPFDEGFFMYSEELDLCRRIKQAGWRIVYEPAARVIHHEGKSSEQVSTQRHIRFNTSKVRYWRKWFGPRWSEALRRYLLLEYRVQIGVEQIKLWLGHKPALRRERIAAYRQVIASGLHASVATTHVANCIQD